jgi:phospholipase/carboxylesterase
VPELLTRRTFLTGAAQCAAAALLGCRDPTASQPTDPSRLVFRTGRPPGSVALGLQFLGLDIFRDGMLYVPSSYTPAERLPLVILLHGAGASGEAWFGSYGPRADAARVVLLAPDSRFLSWDAISSSVGAFGPDVDFISRALTSVFSRCAIDPRRMAIFGFSDGASYALSLGLANGDRFRHLAAFSPGYVIDAPRHGTPDIFISHGTADTVLPITQTSRRIVPELREAGYTVEYTEFAGEHEVPSAISAAAFDWLLSRFSGS